MATRIVTGIIRNANGEPWPEFTLAFTVSPSTYRPDAHYPHQTVRVTTDESGSFEAELVTNVRYLLDLETAFQRRGASTSYPGESKNIPLVVPDGDGPIALEELRGLDGVDPAVPDVKALIEQIIADYLDEHGGMVPHTHPMGDVTGLDDALAGKVDAGALADVATSGDYADLENTPALFDGDYNSLDNVPDVFPPAPHNHDAEYVKPDELHTVATSGSYNDLGDKPVLFDGDYDNLQNVPATFPPEPHTHDEQYAALEHNHDDAYAPLSHASDTNNPHNVTAGQVGAYTKAEVDAAIEDSGGFPGFDGTGTASTAARSDHHHDGTYSPVEHQHGWDDITDKPSTFQPAAHDHAWSEITDKPTTFPPATHNHDGVYSPVGHDHSGVYVEPGDLGTAAGADVDDFAPATHSHSWDSVTGKPSTFPPAAHNHDGTYAPASHSHAWDDITSKPTTFTPSAHGHAIAEVTNLQSSLDGKAAASHTHTIANVTGLQSALDGKASSGHTHTLAGSVQFDFNGGGEAIEAGAEAVIRMNFAGTFTGWDVYSAQPGSFVGTVGKATHSAYPTFTAISGTSKPTLASQNKNQSTTLTGWATSFAAGDVIRIVVDSAATVEQVAVSLRYTRTV